MRKLVDVLIAVIALEHFLFLVLEMFLWTSPTGMSVFGLTAEFAQQSAALAANQGLYNGFLAAGLLWSLVRNGDSTSIKVFFLSCVLIAGVFGAFTVKTTILFVQGAPAFVALLLLWLSRQRDA